MTPEDFARILRLTELKTIDNCLELNKVHSDFMLSVVLKHHSENINSTFDGFAKLTLQMMFTKCLAVEKLLGGFILPSTSGISQPLWVFRKPTSQPAKAAVWFLTNGKIAQGNNSNFYRLAQWKQNTLFM